ncbi:MAG: cell wall-binding repeat-containing protein [Bacillota bacterium]|nr:cell wall-binding repeat-containing protein [Bacillota bacterium]
MECPLTLNTTRICGIDDVNFAVKISKIGFSNMKPNAVILVNKNEIFDGIAASPLVHFPINAPILFTDGYTLSRETLAEIQRLSPKGYKDIQIIMVGNISRNVTIPLYNLGLRTYHITGHNHYETACRIPGERKEFKNILIMSGEDYSEGMVATFWSAHHGDPILYVKKDSIPPCTLETIKKLHNINVYIVGSTKTISTSVETKLSGINNISQVERINGNTPYDIAVNFAKFKDPETEFGWGRNYKEGHAFGFGTLNNPIAIIAGVILAHMGKHSPLLLVDKNVVPESTAHYLQFVKPLPKAVPRPPFMHGFILGNMSEITYNTQVKIEDLISIEHEMD